MNTGLKHPRTPEMKRLLRLLTGPKRLKMTEEERGRIKELYRREKAKQNSKRPFRAKYEPGAEIDQPDDLTPGIEKKFWKNVDIPENGEGCWLWHGYITAKAREGTLKVGKYKEQRCWWVSYILANLKFPVGRIRHTCGNRLCVRPDHLYDYIKPVRTFPEGRNIHMLKNMPRAIPPWERSIDDKW